MQTIQQGSVHRAARLKPAAHDARFPDGLLAF